jgi:predicted kinase
MPNIFIVRGTPGSGKSTYAKKLGIYHLEADFYHMVDGVYSWNPNKVKHANHWCKSMANTAMMNGMDLVVSNTFTRLFEFHEYLELAKSYGYKVKVIRCTGEYGNIHNVPKKTLDDMKTRFENYEGEELV